VGVVGLIAAAYFGFNLLNGGVGQKHYEAVNDLYQKARTIHESGQDDYSSLSDSGQSILDAAILDLGPRSKNTSLNRLEKSLLQCVDNSEYTGADGYLRQVISGGGDENTWTELNRFMNEATQAASKR